MAYDPALSTPADQVRVLIGDTGATQKYPDETINALLALNSNPYIVAATLAEAQAASTADRVSTTVDGLTVAASDKTKAWLALAARLRAAAANGAGTGSTAGVGPPVVGGVSIGDMAGRDADTDRPANAFRTGMMRNPKAAPDTASA